MEGKMEDILKEINQAIIEGDNAKVETGVRYALQNHSANQILYKAMTPAMDVVGKKYEKGEFYIPEMLVAAYAMRTGLAILKPLLASTEKQNSTKIAIGTVQGDLHDIGKNLTTMMLEGAGFDVHDLGVDVSAERFVEAAEKGADIIAMSALLTTTMPQMKWVVERLCEAGQRDKVKVIIGGAPVTQDFAVSIGADGYAPDASQAVTLTRRMI